MLRAVRTGAGFTNHHRKQKRKTSGVPYVAHLLGVTAMVIEDEGTEDEAIAALLHDSLEDQGQHYPAAFRRWPRRSRRASASLCSRWWRR